MKRLYALLIAVAICFPSFGALAWWQSIQQVGVVTGGSLSCSYTPVTTGTQSVAYTGATPSASGGVPSYTFSETGTLPGGLSISSSTGIISGTPSASGSFPGIQVKVTDSASTVANCGSPFTLVISPAVTAMTTPIIGLGSAGPSTTSANFFPLVQGSSSGANGLNVHEQPIAVPGSVSTLFVSFPTGIGSGNWAVALTKNGVITALTCQIVSGTTCTDATHSVSNVAGDTFGWVTCPGTISGTTCTPGTAPTANAVIQVSAQFVSTNNNESFVVGSTASPSTSVFNYASLQGHTATLTTTEVNYSNVMPVAGVFDQLYVDLNTLPGAAKSWTITVMQNGSASTVTCNTGNALPCSDLTHSITVATSDTISIQFCPGTVSGGICTSTTPAGSIIRWGMRWQPTTSGQSLLLMADQNTMPSTTASAYSYVNGSGSTSPGEAGSLSVGALSFTVKNLSVAFSTAPGAAQSRTFTMRTGTGTQSPTALTCNVTNSTSVTACQDTSHSASITAGLFLNWQAAESGTPAAVTNHKISAAMTVP